MSKKLLPDFVLDILRFPQRFSQSKRKDEFLKKSELITADRLIADLKHSGICEGDIIMVHASLSRIGNVVGSAETVIDSLKIHIGKNGTIIMPVFNSAEQVIKDAKRGKLLDLRTSPSQTGKISETFRLSENVFRSSHPFSSVCAWGKQAEYVTSSHDSNHNVCHSDSPIGRVVELGGKIIGIGIPIAQGLGVAHYLEDTWEDFPFEVHTEQFEIQYIDNDGKTITRNVNRYNPNISRTRIDYPEGAWIGRNLTAHLERKGILKRFKFGLAESWIMDANELYHELKRLAAKGVTMYLTKDKLTEQNQDIENW